MQKNLSALCLSFLSVLSAVRGGGGRMSLAALYRMLPTLGTLHAKEKRLSRFLDNPRFDALGVTTGVARMIFGRRGRGLWPIAFDQTKSGSAQALVAGVPFEGRTLPLAVYTFEYPWKTTAPMSQNELERIFLLDLEGALPPGVRAVFIGDRGYARAALLRQCHLEERLFVIRGRGDTCVYCGGRKLKLSELEWISGRPRRYCGVLYQAKEKTPVDVVVYHETGHKEPWFLLVPCGSGCVLSDKRVVALYRERMCIEQTFRDFKTHLGLRGLQLKVRIPGRMGRLLLAFCVAYCLLLALGSSEEGRLARADFERVRKRARHGTQRTLSVLSVAMLMLSHSKWRSPALSRICLIAKRATRGLALLAGGPPRIAETGKAAA